MSRIPSVITLHEDNKGNWTVSTEEPIDLLKGPDFETIPFTEKYIQLSSYRKLEKKLRYYEAMVASYREAQKTIDAIDRKMLMEILEDD